MSNDLQVVLEYSPQEVALDNFTDIVLYDIMGSCNTETLTAFNNPTALKDLKAKYGDKAFLLPDKSKYPIIDPKSGKRDQRLIHAAYIDLKRKSGINPGYADAAQKARDLLDENTFIIEMNGAGETMPLVEFLDNYF